MPFRARLRWFPLLAMLGALSSTSALATQPPVPFVWSGVQPQVAQEDGPIGRVPLPANATLLLAGEGATQSMPAAPEMVVLVDETPRAYEVGGVRCQGDGETGGVLACAAELLVASLADGERLVVDLEPVELDDGMGPHDAPPVAFPIGPAVDEPALGPPPVVDAFLTKRDFRGSGCDLEHELEFVTRERTEEVRIEVPSAAWTSVEVELPDGRVVRRLGSGAPPDNDRAEPSVRVAPAAVVDDDETAPRC